VSPGQEEKPESPEPVDVTILGVHVKSTGYPNVTFRLRDLAHAVPLRTREINFPFRRVRPHYGMRLRAWKPLKFVWSALRLAYAHLYVLLAYVWRGRPHRLYVPYPSAIVLFCLSLLPKSWRPEYVVADCFISLYDTVITDRKLLSSKSLAARVLRFVESRAYWTADRIIVDTDLNASYFAETFGLAPSKIMSLPLSIDADSFRPAPYQPRSNSFTVLFIGTFVPLQGVDIIARAALALESRQDVRFRLIGSGQTADAVERIFANRHPGNVEWITQWMDNEELAREIRGADICLGIFGTGPKTQRVWPLKNYAYMAVGRAIITGDTSQARHMLQQTDAVPFLTVPPGDPAALASAIAKLAGDPERRRKYAENARCYYEKYLSPQKALEQIILQFTRASTAVIPMHSRNLQP
jgi:glycosyltransferase involved in cell wall biosynthesis